MTSIHARIQARTFMLAAALAAFGVGCAMDSTNEPGDPAQAHAAEDLTKKVNAPNTGTSPAAKINLVQSSNPAASEPLPAVVNTPTMPKTLGGPGIEGDGPRPHPWTPTDPATFEPDGHSTNTNSGSSPSSDKGTPDKPSS